jgi:hypothetical protein
VVLDYIVATVRIPNFVLVPSFEEKELFGSSYFISKCLIFQAFIRVNPSLKCKKQKLNINKKPQNHHYRRRRCFFFLVRAERERPGATRTRPLAQNKVSQGVFCTFFFSAEHFFVRTPDTLPNA